MKKYEVDPDFVRVLVSSSTDVIEADDIVQEYGRDEDGVSLSGKETIPLLKKKIAYISELFSGVRILAREIDGETEFVSAQTDYYAILSTLIRQRWGDF